MGKYFEFNSPGPFDSGGYVYSARHILEGAKIGVEEKPSAQLGTLLVNMLGVWLYGFSETGPKLIQALMQAAALIVMFITVRKLFGGLAAAVGVIIASAYLSAPLIAKFGNVKEQYMIACMVIGICCFVWYQISGKWWYALLTGGFLIWAPLFKPTGASAMGAVGLFVIAQPLLKNRTLKQTGKDILFLSAGAVIALLPAYVWILGWNVQMDVPYAFLYKTLAKAVPAGADVNQPAAVSGYVGESRRLVSFSQQWPIVLRYYAALILPIALALGAIAVRIVRMFLRTSAAQKEEAPSCDRLVLLFVLWWLLDMAFVWISPRSYEQYYLPLNASAAMLGGYLIATYSCRLQVAANKLKWLTIGLAGLLVMIVMSWHIFFGVRKSPHTGRDYGSRQRGYAQKLSEVKRLRKQNLKAPWEIVGEYINVNSEPKDKIYVWGWYPGIYVRAKRFSSASKACVIARTTPKNMERIVTDLLQELRQDPPKFIVDSRKRHIPTERPPLELWPIVPQGVMGIEKTRFLQPNRTEVETFDKTWSQLLRSQFDEDEALQYMAVKPLRDFVMNNYDIVRTFSGHVLFRRK